MKIATICLLGFAFIFFGRVACAHDAHEAQIEMRFNENNELITSIKFEIDSESVPTHSEQLKHIVNFNKEIIQNLLFKHQNQAAKMKFIKSSTEKNFFMTLFYQLDFENKNFDSEGIVVQSNFKEQNFWFYYNDQSNSPQVQQLGPGESVGPIIVFNPKNSQALKTNGGLSLFIQYVVLGIEHIIPKGLDHILFILGLYLLSTKFKELLWQISAFTIAHSLTLGLSMRGYISLPSKIVEVIIAASIIFIAVENIVTKELHVWRPVIVFIFGLLHGMGFAGVLTELGPPKENFLSALIGFNLGVELGQLSVIALAFLLVGWWARNKSYYRKRIVIPASALIALVGLYWAIERLRG